MALQPDKAPGSMLSYLAGFVFSIFLSLNAYLAVTQRWLNGNGLIVLLAVFAVLQLAVQLGFFLHLGSEERPRWRLLSTVFAALILGIIVIGSLWIMQNLDYNHDHAPSAQETNDYLIKDEGFGN